MITLKYSQTIFSEDDFPGKDELMDRFGHVLGICVKEIEAVFGSIAKDAKFAVVRQCNDDCDSVEVFRGIDAACRELTDSFKQLVVDATLLNRSFGFGNVTVKIKFAEAHDIEAGVTKIAELKVARDNGFSGGRWDIYEIEEREA